MPAPKGNKYAEGNEGGAPTKYKPEYCQQIIEWFSVNPSEEEEVPHYKDGQLVWTDKRIVSNPLPKFHEFATSIGVTHKTLHNWCNENEEFLQAYTHAKELQKYFLIENGLNGVYNASAFIFTATNITDMRSKSEKDITSKGKSINGPKINYSKLTDSELRSLVNAMESGDEED